MTLGTHYRDGDCWGQVQAWCCQILPIFKRHWKFVSHKIYMLLNVHGPRKLTLTNYSLMCSGLYPCLLPLTGGGMNTLKESSFSFISCSFPSPHPHRGQLSLYLSQTPFSCGSFSGGISFSPYLYPEFPLAVLKMCKGCTEMCP